MLRGARGSHQKFFSTAVKLQFAAKIKDVLDEIFFQR